MSTHSSLAPSSASRWLTCTASVAAIADAAISETTSEAATEGVIAHMLAEQCLSQNKDPLLYKGDYDDEMRQHISDYINYVTSFNFTSISTEVRVPLFYSPNDFGTADVIALKGNELHIIDLKYGQGVFVEVKDNPQLLIYAIAALKMYEYMFKISKVVTSVFQPRMSNVSSWEYSLEELKTHEQNITKQAAITKSETAEFVPSETACHFCALKPQCKALDTYLTKTIGISFDALDELKTISDERMRSILDNKKLIVNWLNAIEKHVLTHLQTGGDFSGYKVIMGKGRRDWGSIKNLLALLQNEAYEKKLLSPAKFEKFVKKNIDKLDKEEVRIVERDIINKQGKEILAPASHKGAEITYVQFEKYEDDKKDSSTQILSKRKVAEQTFEYEVVKT